MHQVSFLRHAAFVGPEDFMDPITIVGCGAVGSYIAYFLAKMGCQKFVLFDKDYIEPHNLPNQAFDPEHIGQKKVDALKKVLQKFNPQIEITTYDRFFSEKDGELVEGPLVLATDTMKSRQEIYNAFYMNTSIDHVFEVRLGFGYGELNIVDTTDPQSCESWKSSLRDDSEIPDGPCNLRICTTLVAIIAAQAAHMICAKYAAERKGIDWDIKSKHMFEHKPWLNIHSF